MKNKHSAFSLIELSIVILIIGIIIAGVTQSSRLVRHFKLQTAQTITKSSPVSGIKGLSAWFETSLDESFIESETEENATVTQWNDINPQSSTKYFLNAGSNTGQLYKASAGANGLPSIYFSSNGQEFDMSDVNNVDFLAQSPTPRSGFTSLTYTMFVVYATTKAGSDSEVEFWNGGSANFEYDNAGSGGTREFFFYGNTTDASSTPIANAGSPEIVSVTFDKTAANMYVNGANHASSAYPIVSSNGDGSFGVYCFEANVSEIIVFDHALKNEDRHSVEAYLAKKYGINVVKNTPADLPI